eukprot:1431468-Amphidinium_carterae.1
MVSLVRLGTCSAVLEVAEASISGRLIDSSAALERPFPTVPSRALVHQCDQLRKLGLVACWGGRKSQGRLAAQQALQSNVAGRIRATSPHNSLLDIELSAWKRCSQGVLNLQAYGTLFKCPTSICSSRTMGAQVIVQSQYGRNPD